MHSFVNRFIRFFFPSVGYHHWKAVGNFSLGNRLIVSILLVWLDERIARAGLKDGFNQFTASLTSSTVLVNPCRVAWGALLSLSRAYHEVYTQQPSQLCGTGQFLISLEETRPLRLQSSSDRFAFVRCCCFLFFINRVLWLVILAVTHSEVVQPKSQIRTSWQVITALDLMKRRTM